MANVPPAQPPQPPPPVAGGGAAAVDPNLALANALAALTQLLQQQQQQQQQGAQPPANQPVLNPYSSVDPFDLASRAGAEAFRKACEPLAEKWDGTIQLFPPFVTALRVKASEANWNAAAPQGILLVAGKNILIDYHSVTEAEVLAAQASRTNPRALQNARAMYHCLKASIDGTLHSQIFQQVGNMPLVEDGVYLFKQLTVYTVGSSTQLSMIAVRQILDFDPSQYEFDVPKINTEMNHLFLLATSNTRTLPETERIQHLLHVYGRIRQPEEWATWVRNQVDNMDTNGIILTSTAFMNLATLKYKKICALRGEQGFGGSTKTITEDVVAMLSKQSKKGTSTKRKSDEQGADQKKKMPRFVRYERDGTGPDAKPHKVGDFRVFEGTKWYFCDCPNHKDGIMWHTHTADTCRTRKKWLEGGGRPKHAKANVATDPGTLQDDKEAPNDAGNDADGDAAPPTAAALLASALPQLDGLAKERVLDALSDLA